MKELEEIKNMIKNDLNIFTYLRDADIVERIETFDSFFLLWKSKDFIDIDEFLTKYRVAPIMRMYETILAKKNKDKILYFVGHNNVSKEEMIEHWNSRLFSIFLTTQLLEKHIRIIMRVRFNLYDPINKAYAIPINDAKYLLKKMKKEHKRQIN